MKTIPYILDIKGNSSDDGPGIRSVIFFKGCPLSCVWCHNPESKKTSQEIAFDQKECIGCNTCLRSCLPKALNRKNPFFIDRIKCSFCFDCVKTCPTGALRIVGKYMTVEQIVNSVIKDKPFFDISGGGVTISGGEPTLFMDFLSELLQALYLKGINTLIETNGFFDFDTFTTKILPYTNTIYYDLKLANPEKHYRFCGVNNDVILNNFSELYKLCIQKVSEKDKFELIPCVPLIPEITATNSNLNAIASFLKNLKISDVRLLPYNPLWQDKLNSLGINKPNGVSNKWISSELLQKYALIFKNAGVNIVD